MSSAATIAHTGELEVYGVTLPRAGDDDAEHLVRGPGEGANVCSNTVSRLVQRPSALRVTLESG
jgi:hypothetical protein